MTHTSHLQPKDVVFKAVGGMAHGRRPCIVLKTDADWTTLLPLSTSDWGGQPYYQAEGCNAKGYAAPNRIHKVRTSDLPAHSGWIA